MNTAQEQPRRRLTPNGLEVWHLLHGNGIVCGRTEVHAHTRFDANGLQPTLSWIVAIGGHPCGMCAQRARLLK